MRDSAHASADKSLLSTPTRQRRLLGFLHALGDRVGNTDFQKLLFLYCKELSSTGHGATTESPYEFVPYRNGAFSFTCYADRRRLIQRGLLVEEDNRWVLTEPGRCIGREAPNGSIISFLHRHQGLRGDALIAETYRRYPYYAIRSTIANRVLLDDNTTLDRIASAQPKETRYRLLSIGYEGRALENFLNTLLHANVSLLCDVRRNAISRKYGFSKSTLARACEGVGIRYQHVPELGIESSQRRGLKTQADFAGLFREYERKALPKKKAVLKQILDWLKSGETVALTCYEREATQCHRNCVTDALCQMLEQKDLFEPNNGLNDQVVQTPPAGLVNTVRHL